MDITKQSQVSAKDIIIPSDSAGQDPKPWQSLDPLSFPHPAKSANQSPPCTLENVEYLLTTYGIVVCYDVISKKPIIRVPGQTGSPDNAMNTAIAHITSLAILNGLSKGSVIEFVMAIADRNTLNPVADYICQKPWDGVDRLQTLYDTLVCPEYYPDALKQTLIYKWLLSAVAAVLKPSGFRCRGVLTLQGPQSIGKTAWIRALISDLILCEQWIKLDHHMDASNKDSILTAISHWIVELGELDSSFKKDIARLKGFITADSDKVRRPYARMDSEYPRRTVFCATVNEEHFLIDDTGNTRFWTIPVETVNYQHNIDMQQVFAQLAVDFSQGASWWLNHNEEKCLEVYNKRHRSLSPIEDRILGILALDDEDLSNVRHLRSGEVLKIIGIANPTNKQFKEAVRVLREHLGPSKRIRGHDVWSVPIREHALDDDKPFANKHHLDEEDRIY
jgi:predicted P-loop ATPase